MIQPNLYDEFARRAARGDRDATMALLAMIRPGVVQYCRDRLGWINPHFNMADDIAQDVLRTVVRSLPHYRDNSQPFSVFVYDIADRKLLQARREILGWPYTSLDTSPGGVAVGDVAEGPLSTRSRFVRGLTVLAAFLAGPRQAGGYDEWRAHLAGTPEEGRALSLAEQRRHAAGFLWAAIQWRTSDVARWAARPLDWVLSTDSRVCAAVVVVVTVAAIHLAVDNGLIEIWHNGQNLFAVGAGTWSGLMLLRRARGITPVPRQAVRGREGVEQPVAQRTAQDQLGPAATPPACWSSGSPGGTCRASPGDRQCGQAPDQAAGLPDQLVRVDREPEPGQVPPQRREERL